MTSPSAGPVRWAYHFTDVLTGRLLAILPLRDVSLSDVLSGAASGKATVPLAERGVMPRDPFTATRPRRTMCWAVRQEMDEDGRKVLAQTVPWAGLVRTRSARRSARSLDLQMTTWPSYYASRLLPDLTFAAWDSLDVFRALLDYGTSQTPGTPTTLTEDVLLRVGPVIDPGTRPAVVPLFPAGVPVWAAARRNLEPDPAGTGTVPGAWTGTYPGSGAVTFRTGQADGPAGTGLTSYARRTVTTASGAPGIGFDHHGNHDQLPFWVGPTVPASDRLPITGGRDYTVSAYVRSSVSRYGNLRCRFYNSGGGPVGDWFSSAITAASVLTAGQWVRLTATGTAPADAAYLVVRSNYQDARGLAVGDTLDVTGLQVEEGRLLGTYFDGGTVDTAAVRYDWSGTANASAAVQEASRPGPLAGDRITRSYAESSNTTVLDAVTELAAQLNIDWRFTPYLDAAADTFAPRLRLDLGTPRIGRTGVPELRWSANRQDTRSRWGYIEDYALDEDGTVAANRMSALRDDGSRVIVTAADLGVYEAAEGVPLYEAAFTGTGVTGSLTAAVTAELGARLESEVRLTGVKVRGDLPPVLTSYALGDEVQVRADEKLHGRDLTLTGQIIGRTITPGQQGSSEWVELDIQGTVS